MVQIYYLHHCRKEVKIYSYHDLDFYIHRNYPQHNLKELVLFDDKGEMYQVDSLKKDDKAA